ncbi:hypothetical protein [Roseicyclus sp.]|uniref:hypothetical protein n=1 Tax=Roseicyclus sp. TaxID=1914329 RepID=UPI003F6D6F2B
MSESSHRKVAILELTGVHEEVIPSLVDAVPSGVTVDVFVNARCRDIRGDIFREIKGFTANVRYLEIAKAIDWVKLGRDIDGGGYEALIISTFQIEGVALWARERKPAVIGVVHNPTLFQKSAASTTALAEGRISTIVLAPHVAARFNAMTHGAHMDAIGVIEPVFWGEGARAWARSDSPKQVIVPGGVNFSARDFEGLLDALEPSRVAAMRHAGIALQIIGGGPDRAKLEEQVTERGLEDVVGLLALSASGRVPYDAYVAALIQAWAIYPLLPLEWPPYRDYKITSAIPTAIGFGLPVVLDRWTASAYRVPALISDASIATALDALIALSPDRHAQLVDEILRYGTEARARNRIEMARLIAAGRMARTEALI